MIQSVSDFLNAIKKIKNEKIPDLKTIWFRGQSNARFDPIPSVFRDENWKDDLIISVRLSEYESKVKNKFEEGFIARSSLSCEILNNPWFSYYVRQHYGIKTRLLDWTENPLVALYFAINEIKKDENGKVFILNSSALNSRTTSLWKNNGHSTTGIFKPHLTQKDIFAIDFHKYLTADFEYEEDKPYFPLAIYPIRFDKRMDIQASCFTIFGNRRNGLKTIPNSNEILFEFEVDNQAKMEILSELELLGISKTRLFPDLQNFCEDINIQMEEKRKSIIGLTKAHQEILRNLNPNEGTL